MLRLHVMISIITLTQIYHDGLVIMINVTVNNGNFLKYTSIKLEGEKYIEYDRKSRTSGGNIYFCNCHYE